MANVQTQLESAKNALKNNIETNLPDGTIGDIIGSKEIIAKELSALPVTLPYKPIVTANKISVVPDQLRHKIQVSIADPFGFETLLTTMFSTAQIAGKRLTLSYMPASSADAQTIDTAGGYYKVKPYLVKLRPMLYLEGAVTASGGSIGMGEDHEVAIIFISPDGAQDRVTHQIAASTFAALGLDLQRVPAELINKRKADLEEAKNGLGNNNVPLDDLIGETLNLHALSYFQQVEGINRIASTGRLAYLKRPAEMLATLNPSIGTLFGVPFSIESLSMNIDVKRYVISPLSLTGNAEQARSFMVTTGSWGSAMEHAIFEQTRKLATQGVSAVKVLSIANQQGIPIFNVDSQNVDVIIPQLQIEPGVKADIRSAVNSGKTIVVPKQTIQHVDWVGIGYLVLDPDTGAGGYLISGGLAGGGTAQHADVLGLSFDSLLDAISYLADFSSAFLDLSKYLSKIVPRRGERAILDAFGNFLAVVSAFAQALDMYNKTNCAWKAGAAASADFLVSVLAGMLTGYLTWLFIATTVLSAIFAALFIVLIVSVLAFIVVQLLLTIIEEIPYCLNILQRMIFVKYDLIDLDKYILLTG